MKLETTVATIKKTQKTRILDMHGVPVEVWSSLHPQKVDFVRNLR